MSVVTSWVVPLLGCFMGIARHTIATREVLAVRSGQRLGDLNPLPFAATILNCSGWVVYTILIRNWFVFCTDVPGLLCSIWMTFSLYPYASPSVQNQLNAFIVLAAVLWCVLGAVTMILQEHSTQAVVVSLWGWAVSVTQVVLMASPLSGLLKAIQQRSSANFHLGVCAAGLLSSSLWAIYAMTIKNLFLAIPSFLGGLLSCASLLVCFVFPRSPAASPAQQDAAHVQAAVNAVQMG